jgi:CheY-like chemotaxis protein
MNEPPSRKKLLLVEENIATAARLGEMLTQQAGYQVIVASDCVTALKFIRSCKPDLMCSMRWDNITVVNKTGTVRKHV